MPELTALCQSICEISGLVARRLEPLGQAARAVFGSSYRVVPRQTGQILTIFVEKKIENSAGSTWDHLSGPFSANQVTLTLIDFFDWNVHDWRDFRYYRVKILAFETSPELVGRDGLVDVLEADVIWNAET